MRLSLYVCLSILLLSCNKSFKVDLIVYNALIYTVNNQFSTAESMAVKDGKIVAIGKNNDIDLKYSSEQRVDAKNKPIFPGLIDAHCHFTGYGLDLYKLNLIGTKSWDEILSKVLEYSKSYKEDWIYGRGWDQNDWADKSFPDNSKLDSLFPDRPVYLKRIDGHAVIANSKALSLANISVNTKVDGGEVLVKNGKLTGVLIDNAFKLVEDIIPQLDKKKAINYLAQASDSCFQFGLTTVVDCGVDDNVIQWLDEAQKNGNVKMRVVALLSDNGINYNKYIKLGSIKNNLLNINGFKLYSDGALGSRGACLSEEYSDMPGHRGFLLRSKTYFDSIINVISKTNFQVCTHAIGDSANRVILNAYGKFLVKNNDKRWRIEHAQMVHPIDFELFGKYNIIPSVQPTHATSDMYWAGDRIGKERLKSAYSYKQLLEQNGWIPLGTDFPVEYINPFFTFYSAVARKDGNNFPTNGFQMENALTREEAIKGMTIWAAKGSFEENEKGSLEVGKFADFVILDTDLMKDPIEKTRNTKVISTWIGGKKVY
jgi:predicted amidohydrolase YtcJ